MASMNFDQKTVSDLMSLIDDHKDDIIEADYIKICNVMKFLHQRTSQPQCPQVLQRTDFPPHSDLLARYNSLHCRVRELNRLKISLERSVSFHLSESRDNGRLTLQDKHNVLVHLIGLTNDFYRTNCKPNNALLKEMEKHVLDQEITTLTNLKKMYYDEKKSRMSVKHLNALQHCQIKHEQLQQVNRRIERKNIQIQQIEYFI